MSLGSLILWSNARKGRAAVPGSWDLCTTARLPIEEGMYGGGEGKGACLGWVKLKPRRGGGRMPSKREERGWIRK